LEGCAEREGSLDWEVQPGRTFRESLTGKQVRPVGSIKLVGTVTSRCSFGLGGKFS
jgi:hypothetical protein